MKAISCYINIAVLLCVYCGCEESKTTSRLGINLIILGWLFPLGYRRDIPTDIPHPIILSNIRGRGGARFTKKMQCFTRNIGGYTDSTPTN